MSSTYEEMLQSKESLESINSAHSGEEKPLLLPRQKKFAERNQRVTLYLTNETYSDLQAVRSQGYNQSALVEQAVKEFLAKNWPTGGHE